MVQICVMIILRFAKGLGIICVLIARRIIRLSMNLRSKREVGLVFMWRCLGVGLSDWFRVYQVEHFGKGFVWVASFWHKFDLFDCIIISWARSFCHSVFCPRVDCIVLNALSYPHCSSACIDVHHEFGI
jgi:hypothetical protein